jgi:hypothetical protein
MLVITFSSVLARGKIFDAWIVAVWLVTSYCYTVAVLRLFICTSYFEIRERVFCIWKMDLIIVVKFRVI